MSDQTEEHDPFDGIGGYLGAEEMEERADRIEEPSKKRWAFYVTQLQRDDLSDAEQAIYELVRDTVRAEMRVRDRLLRLANYIRQDAVTAMVQLEDRPDRGRVEQIGHMADYREARIELRQAVERREDAERTARHAGLKTFESEEDE